MTTDNGGQEQQCVHLTMRTSTYRYAFGDKVAAKLHMTCNSCGQQWWYRREDTDNTQAAQEQQPEQWEWTPVGNDGIRLTASRILWCGDHRLRRTILADHAQAALAQRALPWVLEGGHLDRCDKVMAWHPDRTPCSCGLEDLRRDYDALAPSAGQEEGK